MCRSGLAGDFLCVAQVHCAAVDHENQLLGGNRQINASIHRIALTQARHHPDAKALIERRTASGNTKKEAMRVLKRRLSDVVYRAMLKDANSVIPAPICA